MFRSCESTANRAEARERGEELIVAWLTAMRDAGYLVTPPAM